ncbi:hypothetical protein V2J09_001288 [Rumex salicifolius]
MTKKNYQPPSLHGFLLVTLLLALPTAWSKPESDSKPAGPTGPGASSKHLIPADASKVESWFSKIIKPAKARKDIEPDLVQAEAKAEIIKVRQDGSGKFKTIMEAVNSVEVQGNDNRVIIDIGPGVYYEKIVIDRYRPYITLYGSPFGETTLLFDATVRKYDITDTATLTVESDYFIGVNLNIVNSSPRPDATNANGFGSTLRVTGNMVAFYNCKIVGFKSTILDDKGKHFYKDCKIEGMDDIIVGDARSIFLNTRVNVLPNEPVSIISDQAREDTDPRGGGFVFAHCNVTGFTGKVLLGDTYMAGSRVIYAYTYLSDIVLPKGWSDDFMTNYEKTGFFAEYKNKGPGADTSKRIKEPCLKTLTKEDVKEFLSLDFIDASEWLLPPPSSH